MTYQDVLDALDSILEKLRGNNSELCEKLGIEIDDPYINGEEVDSEEVDSDEGDFEGVEVEIDNEDNVDNEQSTDDDDDDVELDESGKDASQKSLLRRASDSISDTWNNTKKWAKDNPGTALAAAAGTGLAAALIGNTILGDDEEDESTQQSFNESNDETIADSLNNIKDNAVGVLSSASKLALKPIELVAHGGKYAIDKAGEGMDYVASLIPSETKSVQTTDDGEQLEINTAISKKQLTEPTDDTKSEGEKSDDKKSEGEKSDDDEIVIDDNGDENGEESSSSSTKDIFGMQKAADKVKSGAIIGGALIGGGLLGSALLKRRRRRRS